VVDSACDVVVCRWVWWGEPTSDVPLELITCEVRLAWRAQLPRVIHILTFHSVYFFCCLLYHNYHASSILGHLDDAYRRNIPRAARTLSVVTLPSIQTNLSCLIAIKVCSRTIHDYLQIVEDSVDHFQSMSYGHPSFRLCESVQSPKDSLDIALSHQLLCKFLYATLK